MSEFEPINQVAPIIKWRNTIKVPTELDKWLRVFEAANKVEKPAAAVDIAALTESSVADDIQRHAERLAELNHWSEAFYQVRDSLARQAAWVARQCVPEICTEQMQPELDAAVAELSSALEFLPEQPDYNVLVDCGADAVNAWHTAKAAEARIFAVDEWVSTLRPLYSPSYNNQRPPGLRLLAPSTTAQWWTISGQSLRGGNRVLSPLAIHAIRDGITWRVNTPDEERQIAAAINTLLQEQRVNKNKDERQRKNPMDELLEQLVRR